jgi:hypothetical protein
MTDSPICGYGLADGGMCILPRAADADRCSKHRGLVCRGRCDREATHDCSAPACGEVPAPLCAGCVHVTATQHGRPRTTQSAAEEEMARSVELILEGLNDTEVLPSTQLQRRDAAGAIWRGLSNHIAMKVLAGLARPEKGE